MDYEVGIAYGSEGFITENLDDVDEVTVEDGAYFFYDEEEEMIFSVPLDSVVYIKRL